MKKVLILAAVNALALLAWTPAATADWDNHWQEQSRSDQWERGTDWRPTIRDRIVAIRRSIHEGVESGQLTRHEADRARSELNSVRDEMDRMNSDGYLNERERDRVIARLDDVNRDVWRLRHNDRTARY